MTYSWGEFYETAKACENYEEIKEKFAIFEALDDAKTLQEIKDIIWLGKGLKTRLTQEQIDWLNSPCLDGIIETIENPRIRLLLNKEFPETCKYYLDKGLIKRFLIGACRAGFTKIVEVFLDRGANIHFNKNQALIYAFNRNIETAKFLLERGAIITDDNRGYYLYDSIKHGSLEMVQRLLTENYEPKTELQNAIYFDHMNIVKFLLDKGYKVNIEYSSLINDLYKRDKVDMVKLLITELYKTVIVENTVEYTELVRHHVRK